MTEKPEYRDLLETEEQDQEPWWKRQEREAKERTKQLKDDRKKLKNRELQWKLHQEQERPNSIKYFEWLWLGSILIGIIVSAISYQHMLSEIQNEFGELGSLFEILVPIGTAIGVGLTLLFVLLTSRRQNKVAKWFLVIMFGLGLAFSIPELNTRFGYSVFVGILSSIQIALQCVGIYFLFTSGSRAWFAGIQIENDEDEG